jgi:anti-sigma28 factor (negative regulator of flagellin synthesis)
MKKNMEDALKTILSNEQVAALKEEIASGIKKMNSAVESNEK